MAGSSKQKKIVGSTVYTIAGGLLMNGVLQAVVYPLLNRQMGSEPLGALLFIMGVLGILSPSVGQALNTSRLVVRRTSDVTNGDYNTLLLVFGVIGGVITLIICRTSFGNAAAAAATFVLLMLMIFRYYGDVEYRLSLHYEKYFIYYAVLTAGYLVGFALYYVTKIWFFIFIVGEGAALIYLTVTGSVFKNFLVRSRYFRTAAERGTFLMFSYVITNLTLNIDRLALKFLIDDLAVTKYYVASLLGKTLILLVTPVNTIIISFLTKRKKELDKREYLMFVGAGAGVAAAFFAAIQIAAPIFLKIFYPNLLEDVRPILMTVNLSQIMGLYSAYLFVVVLTFTEEKWQMILQIAHLVIIAVLVTVMTGAGSIEGFAGAVLAANTIRVLAVALFGFIMNGRSKAAGK